MNLLHLKADSGGGDGSRGISGLVEASDGGFSRVGGELGLGIAGLGDGSNAVGTSATED